MEALKSPKLIHIGSIIKKGMGERYVFLRENNPHLFSWYEQPNKKSTQEIETDVFGTTKEDAILKAHKKWKSDSFRTIICGFRYTLPERDEHGINALFHQMKDSYLSSNGIYFDIDLGHNCFVNSASMEARDLLYKLKEEDRL